MEMKIGAKLVELRRKKGLTQEQLAERLGISAPAVSKWETGNSYPDITLLCPLARALGTNVDTLLRFEEQLSTEEMLEKVNAAIEAARQEGWEAGERRLGELLRQYPNSEGLKYNAALAQNAYQMFHPGADPEVQKRWMARKVELLTDVRASGSGAYWQAATLQLAQAAAAGNRLEEAERLLKELPEQEVDPTAVWAQIYIMRGKAGEALKTVQRQLYKQVLQVQGSLGTMLLPGVIPEEERELEVCRVYQEVDRLFGLGGMYDGLFLEAYLRMGRWEEAAGRLERCVDALLGTVEVPNSSLFSPGVEAVEKPASSRELRAVFLKELNEKPQCRPVLEYEKARAAVRRLEASLED